MSARFAVLLRTFGSLICGLSSLPLSRHSARLLLALSQSLLRLRLLLHSAARVNPKPPPPAKVATTVRIDIPPSLQPVECARALNERVERNNSNRSAVITAALKAYLSGKLTADVVQSYVVDSIKMAQLESEVISLRQRLEDKDRIIATRQDAITALKDALVAVLTSAHKRRQPRVSRRTSRREGMTNSEIIDADALFSGVRRILFQTIIDLAFRPYIYGQPTRTAE